VGIGAWLAKRRQPVNSRIIFASFAVCTVAMLIGMYTSWKLW
jgi:hypothetical protein